MSIDTRPWALVTAVVAVGATVSIVALFLNGQTDMAAGMAVGITLALSLGFLAHRRSRRHPDKATSLDRLVGGTADERDKTNFRTGLAYTGTAALLLATVATIVSALDGDAAASIVAAQPTALLGIFAIGVLVADRRT